MVYDILLAERAKHRPRSSLSNSKRRFTLCSGCPPVQIRRGAPQLPDSRLPKVSWRRRALQRVWRLREPGTRTVVAFEPRALSHAGTMSVFHFSFFLILSEQSRANGRSDKGTSRLQTENKERRLIVGSNDTMPEDAPLVRRPCCNHKRDERLSGRRPPERAFGRAAPNDWQQGNRACFKTFKCVFGMNGFYVTGVCL